MYKRNRASGNSGEKIACGKLRGTDFKSAPFLVSVLFDKPNFFCFSFQVTFQNVLNISRI